MDEIGYQARDALRLSLDVTILNLMVFPLDVTEFAQSLAECFDIWSRIIWIASSRDEADARDFSRRLLGGNEAEWRL